MKKLLTIAMITLAAIAAKADLYLYWMADVTDTEWSSASIVAELYADGNPISNFTVTNWGSDTAINSSYTSYWVKLYDTAINEYVAESTDKVTYGQIVASNPNAIANHTGTDKPASSVYSFQGFTATIPEPTSGLMLLLGLGALALKRKHV